MSGPGRFARASAVTAIDGGRYAAEVARGWDIAGNADGGYLLAIAARAVTEATAKPDLPPPDACPLSIPGDPFPPPFVGRVEMRLHPDDIPFRTGDTSGNAHMRGWFRPRDDKPLDTLTLVLAVDAFPPTSFNVNLPVGWTPTIELTAHVRARPGPGWLACAFVTRNISGGYLETDGEIWDSAGALVAQSRQLQLIPAPT